MSSIGGGPMDLSLDLWKNSSNTINIYPFFLIVLHDSISGDRGF
jgi:hypothetical protein